MIAADAVRVEIAAAIGGSRAALTSTARKQPERRWCTDCTNSRAAL